MKWGVQMNSEPALNKEVDSCFRRNDGSGEKNDSGVFNMNTGKNDEMKTSMKLKSCGDYLREVRFSI